MIERFLAMLGINPENFQQQIEKVQAEAVAVVKHFDAKTTAIQEGQQALALALNTVIENQRILFEIVAKQDKQINGTHYIEHDENEGKDNLQ